LPFYYWEYLPLVVLGSMVLKIGSFNSLTELAAFWGINVYRITELCRGMKLIRKQAARCAGIAADF
jgi:hypothetical protein